MPNKCSQCEASLISGMRFCPNCGFKVNQKDNTLPVAPDTDSQVLLNKPELLAICCTKCGTSPGEVDEYCRSCGSNLPPSSTSLTPKQLLSTCPSCGGTNFQRVTGIVKKGTLTSNASTFGSAVGLGAGGLMLGIGSAESRSKTTSELVKLLGAPSPGCLAQAIALFILAGVLCCIFRQVPLGITSIVLGILFTIVGKKELNRDSLRRKKWEILFYCHRCDSVFDPQSGRSASSSSMKSVLD